MALVSEISTITWLRCFWAHGEGENHNRRAWWSRAAHLLAARKRRKEEEGQTENVSK